MEMDMQFYTSLFFLWLLFYLFHRYILPRSSANRCKTANLPPSPISLPLIGHLYLLGPVLHQSLDALAKRYGPIIHLRLGSMGDTVVVSSPAMAKEFLKTHDLSFASRLRLVCQEYVGGEESISFSFLPYGDQWRFFKKILMTELLSARKLEKMARIRQEEVRFFLGSLLEKSRARERPDLNEMLAALTNNVICGTMVSMKNLDRKKEADELRKLVQEHIDLAGKMNIVHLLSGSIGKLDLLGYGKRLKKANERFMAMVDRILDEHERKRQLKRELKINSPEEEGEVGKEEEEYLVDILLKISEDEESEFKMTRRHIRTLLLDIAGGGTESSALAVQWALAELLNHPIIFRKAREEIDSVVGTNRLVQESDIPNLPYIQAVVKETLRMHSPVPINIRTCREDCTVAGFYIPKDTKLFVNVWALGRDPEQWEKPLEFRPERFLSSDGTCLNAVDVKGQHFQLLPFGSGRRMCPGMTLALTLMQVTIASIVQCFDWIAPNGDVNSIKMELKEKAGFTNHMAQPLCCIPLARCVPFTNPL